jgi:hypothetical protein
MGTDSPETWARRRIARAEAFWNGKPGAVLRAMAPVVFPDAPAAVFVGFCLNAGQTENTTEVVPKQAFHEMGWWGTEGGMRDKPAPNPNAAAKYNSWGKLHADSLVVSLLGRKATMRHNAWKQAIEDQHAIGLVNVRRHALNALGPLWEPPLGSLWEVAAGFAAWSAGSSRMGARFERHRAALAAVPEGERWAAYCALVAQEKPGASGSHSNAAYSVLRTLQKLECGRTLAVRVGQPTTWWDAGPDAATVETIVRHARGTK